MRGLVLSLFPGIGLLDRAFEEEGGVWGSAKHHKLTLKKIDKADKRRRLCACGCKKRVTHLVMANGVALAEGCELRARRWRRDLPKY